MTASDRERRRYTIACRRDSRIFKVCKLIFGSDGSYYVTSPYHRLNRAYLVKMPWVNNDPRGLVHLKGFEEAMDAGGFDDDESRLKLSHHPDGFVQFSGPGLISGRDSEGRIRGMGVMAWTLDCQFHAMAFGIVIRGLEELVQIEKEEDGMVLFDWSEFAARSDADVLYIEAHYFPSWIRYYARTGPKGPELSTPHPAGVFFNLKVIFPPESSPVQNFFGLHAFAYPGEDIHPKPSFALSGPIGNIRLSTTRQQVGESLSILYPRPEEMSVRTLGFPPKQNQPIWAPQVS